VLGTRGLLKYSARDEGFTEIQCQGRGVSLQYNAKDEEFPYNVGGLLKYTMGAGEPEVATTIRARRDLLTESPSNRSQRNPENYKSGYSWAQIVTALKGLKANNS
jgi:hypothetical protein